MKRMTKQLVAVAIAMILGLSIVALRVTAGDRNERAEKAPYKSSIQVPDNDGEDEAKEENGENEQNEQNEGDEAAEEAQLRPFAKITKQQAVDAALKHTAGQLVKAELDNEDGNLVYSVEVKTNAGVQEVIVDAGNAKVLHVSNDGDEDEEND